MAYELENKVQWRSEDERAFWALWPDYEAAMSDPGRYFRSGFDPSKVPHGAAPPPTIQEISREGQRARNPVSRIYAHEVPVALPLGPFLRRRRARIPVDIQILAQQYSPFLLVYGIDVDPAKREKITGIRIRLSYPDGGRFMTHSLAPETALEERYAINVQAAQGVDLNLNFEIPTTMLLPGVAVGAGLTTDLDGSMLVHWQHRRVRARVIAMGVRRGLAEWKFNDAENLVGRVDLRAVVLAPKRAREVVRSLVEL